jgi:hypothetical protein
MKNNKNTIELLETELAEVRRLITYILNKNDEFLNNTELSDLIHRRDEIQGLLKELKPPVKYDRQAHLQATHG